MNRRHTSIPILAFAIASLAAGGAFAAEGTSGKDEGDQPDVQMMENARLSLVDAIQAAETAAGGKAVSAAFEGDGGTLAYEVEVASPDGTSSLVMIDGGTGDVLKTQKDTGEDTADNEDDESGEHEQDVD